MKVFCLFIIAIVLAAAVVELNNQPETLNVVSGIEVLNEPKTTLVCGCTIYYLNICADAAQIGGPIEMPMLMLYYEEAYAVIRAANFTGDIWVHDGCVRILFI